MAEDPPKRRLGRGLAALIGDIDTLEPAQSSPVTRADSHLPIEAIVPNPRNPRRSFREDDLTDLAQSIREHGLVQPIVVRSGKSPGHYEIIAGERRWRAAQRAGLSTVPALIRDVDDRVALELAIIENVQRADLNPIEEALGYQQLVDDHSYSQTDLAQVIGKSRSHVANTLRLLKLPDPVRSMLVDGVLSAGHARSLITAADPEVLARQIVSENLSVRQAEALAQKPNAGPSDVPPRLRGTKDADTVALEKLLTDATGLKVNIAHGDKGGDVRIAYRTLEQLDELCRRLKG